MEKNIITPFPEEYFLPSAELLGQITDKINKSITSGSETYVNFHLSGGLAISKNIIEKHNGEIAAKNSDSGALFIIELPITSVKSHKI